MKTTYDYHPGEDVEIVVGDEKQQDFFPRMKIKRWDNEVNFSVGVVSEHDGTDKKDKDKIEWDDGHGMKARFYEKKPITQPVAIPGTFRYIDLGSITPDMVERIYEIERHGIEPTIITYTPDADCFVVHGHQPFSDYIDKEHTVNEVRLLNFGGNSPIMFGDPDTAVIDIQFDSSIYSSRMIFDRVHDALCKEFKLHGHGRYYNDKEEKVATLIRSKNHVVGYIRFRTIVRSKFLRYCNSTVNDAAQKYKVGSVTGDIATFIDSIRLNLIPGKFTPKELTYPRVVGDYTVERNVLEDEHQRSLEQFEFEIELASKPASNVIDLSIETKGLNFLYQPHDVPVGCFRPENVKGSYAVHHADKKGNEYRTGKAFHIYRPHVTDANGKTEWCDMDISGGVMRITVPGGLAYPVVIDPTFGVAPASPGGSWQDWNESFQDNLYGSLFMSPNDLDTCVSISVYIKNNDTKNGHGLKGVVVLHSNLNIVSNGVSPAIIAPSETIQWNTGTFANTPDVSLSTEYVLMAIQNDWASPTSVYTAYDTGDANQGHRDTTNSYASPTNPTDANHNSNKYSIYCTYTETGGAAGARPSRVFYGPFMGPLGGPIQ